MRNIIVIYIGYTKIVPDRARAYNLLKYKVEYLVILV